MEDQITWIICNEAADTVVNVGCIRYICQCAWFYNFAVINSKLISLISTSLELTKASRCISLHAEYCTRLTHSGGVCIIIKMILILGKALARLSALRPSRERSKDYPNSSRYRRALLRFSRLTRFTQFQIPLMFPLIPSWIFFCNLFRGGMNYED